jgi:hypothetical protein
MMAILTGVRWNLSVYLLIKTWGICFLPCPVLLFGFSAGSFSHSLYNQESICIQILASGLHASQEPQLKVVTIWNLKKNDTCFHEATYEAQYHVHS